MAGGYRDGPWMWLGGIGMDPGCGWGVYRWTLDVAGGYRDGPWMWLGGIGMDPGCGWGV